VLGGSLSVVTDLIVRTQEWIAGDPDPETRAELEALLEAEAFGELADRMAGTLEFGTAGLRGRVEAGSNRMNRAVVIRATWGLAQHVLASSGPDRGPVVVGRDARLSSPQFLDDTVGVLAAAGLAVAMIDGPSPTPVIAYVAKEMGAVAAIIITASHNPPADNGYKAYAANAVQIVPPDDTSIASFIESAPPAIDVAVVESPRSHPLVSQVPAHIIDAYHGEVLATVPTPPDGEGPAWCTQPCTGSAERRLSNSSRGPDSTDWCRCQSSSSPTATSRPSPSPTPRNRGPWTSPTPSQPRWEPTL
jgi:hypothetical protein